MISPSRFELTAEQLARNTKGAATCRDTIAEILARRAQPEQPAEPTRSEEIHQRALERAIGEKRDRRLVGLEPIGTVMQRLADRRSRT